MRQIVLCVCTQNVEKQVILKQAVGKVGSTDGLAQASRKRKSSMHETWKKEEKKSGEQQPIYENYTGCHKWSSRP